jgi:hypothetical protein
MKSVITHCSGKCGCILLNGRLSGPLRKEISTFFWLATFIVVLVATVSVFRPSLFALCFLIAWFFLSQEIFKRIIPRYNESWEEVFDRLLSDYEPLNLSAWEHLKHQAETEGLTVSIVSNWYQEEVRTVWPEKKPDLKFLHKVTDGNEKIGEE